MIRLAYIASSSYSGSTLLTRLLNEHPQIATVGELKGGIVDPEVYQCSCSAALARCAFWQFVAAELEKNGLQQTWNHRPTDFRTPKSPVLDRIVRARVRGSAFESLRDSVLTLTPALRPAFHRIRSYNRATIEASLRWYNALLFVDASKDPVRLKHLIDSSDYDIHIIHLIRDGRGVTHSAIKNRGERVGDCANDWRKTNLEIEHLSERMPDRNIQVRYEDLCANPREVLTRLFKFLGLTQAGMSFDAPSREHHILGNRMRLRSLGSITDDQSWRTGLIQTDLRSFDKLAGAMNRRYGYA